MKWKTFSLGILAAALVSAAAAADPDLPSVVRKLDRAMSHGPWEGGTPPKDFAGLFAPPVTVEETAFEIGDGACQPHYRTVTAASPKDIQPFLEEMRRVWAGTAPAALKDGWYGVAETLDCEHLWAVRLNKAGTKIIALRLDAKDNVWKKDRKNFP